MLRKIKKITGICFALISFVLTLAPAEAKGFDASLTLSRGMALWNIGEHDLAVPLFESVVSDQKEGVCQAPYTAEAANHLGEYHHFYAPAPNAEKAKHYYLIAFGHGHPIAANHLGGLYLNGTGVTQSSDQAAAYYKMACENGHKPSCHFSSAGVK